MSFYHEYKIFYFRNKYDTKDLLGKPQVGMEIEASRKALEIVKRVYGKGNLPDIRNLTVPRLKALAFELGVVSTKKGGIHKLKKDGDFIFSVT